MRPRHLQLTPVSAMSWHIDARETFHVPSTRSASPKRGP
jgi:hypothetical protein